MKVYVIQGKNRIVRKVGGSVKNEVIAVLINMIICWILVRVINCVCNKSCEIDESLDVKNCSCEKCLFGKLVLACEDEILATTEISLRNRRVICEKNNCLIYDI